MQISDLLATDRIANDMPAASKKRLLEQISALLASGQTSLTQSEIFESLISRERLGSTGFGHGVAIPHGRAAGADHTVAAFVRLGESIDFDAIDGQPVDLLFALLVPEESTDEHLELLSHLARMFSDPALLEQLRAAAAPEAIYKLLSEWQPPD